jgi:hypothetical protein
MWYRIRDLWSVWFAEWHPDDVPLEELLDIVDI